MRTVAILPFALATLLASLAIGCSSSAPPEEVGEATEKPAAKEEQLKENAAAKIEQTKEKPAANEKQTKIVISKETTYLLEPLTEDGYVDYIAAINARQSEGVTPENNIVALLVQLGKKNGIAAAAVREEYFKRLGVPAPDGSLAIVSLEEALKTEASLEVVSKLHGRFGRPWRSADEPLLAKWIARNAKQLALVREALERPRYYSPLVLKSGMLLMGDLDHINLLRETQRLLVMAALQQAGDGKLELAARDIALGHKLAAHVSKDGSQLSFQVAIAIDSLVCQAEASLASDLPLKAGEGEKLRQNLKQAPRLYPLADSFDRYERLIYLDILQQMARKPVGLGKEFGVDAKMIEAIGRIGFDWNAVLRSGNSHYDAMAATARETDSARRNKLADEYEAEIKRRTDAARDWETVLKNAVSSGKPPRAVAGELLENFLSGLISPSLAASLASEQRAIMHREAADVAFALAIYRAENGSYPDRLEALVPKHLAALPADLWNKEGGPICYRKEKGRYVLYSVGRNGIDDGGSEDSNSGRFDELFVRPPEK